MKVSGLAALLRELPQDAQVVTSAFDRGYHEVRFAGLLQVEKYPDGRLCEHYKGCEGDGAKVIDVVVVV